MQFLSLASAWFAAALPAIAAMYILKRVYENKEIASHLLWRRVMQEQEANRPWQKLRSRWLLYLQLLIAAFIIFALMEPVMTKPAAPTGHAVLLIDRSASMAARAGESNGRANSAAATRLELAIREAERWLDEQDESRPITLVATGARPEVLDNRQANKEQIKQQLRAITPFYGKSDNAAALSLADSLAQGDKTGETVIFTDGHWSDAEEANMLELQAPIDLFLVDETEPRGNVSILYFGIKADPDGNGSSKGIITVRNDSRKEQTIKLDVIAVSDGMQQSLAAEPSVTVKAGEWQSVQVNELPPALYYKAQIQQQTDAVPADNIAYQFPAMPRTRQALLVTEGNLFLEKALRLAGVQTVKLSPESAVPTGGQTAAADWIVLDGMNERLLADKEWSKLLAKKPVWMIDHPGQSDETAAVPANARVLAKEHPVTSYLTFADTHIGRFAKPEPAELLWGEAVLSYGGIPAIYAGMKDGKPQLRFTFNLQDTDLPLRPEFPVLIVQAAQWMSGGAHLELGTAIAEQPVELSLHSDTVKAAWEAIEPADTGLPSGQALLRQSAEPDIKAAGQYIAPSVPGLYRFVERNTDDVVVSSRLLAVTADHAELLGGGTSSEAELKLASIRHGNVKDDLSKDHRTERVQQVSLQLYAAILLLLIMAAEWEVYRRGISG